MSLFTKVTKLLLALAADDSQVVTAATTPAQNDKTKKLATTEWIHPLARHGQCRLSVVSGTSLKLSRYNGACLIINSTVEQIPAVGVTIANTGLTASTLYYVYAYMNSGTMTLELSATGHSTHTDGVEIKTGDATRTLVGMIFTNASTPGQFVDAGEVRTLANWFNRRDIHAATATISDQTNNTAALEELTGGRAYVCSWADEAVEIAIVGSVHSNTAGNVVHTTSAGIDGASSGAQTIATTYAASVDLPAYARAIIHPAEGMHYGLAMGKVSTGTGTWSFGTQMKTRA